MKKGFTLIELLIVVAIIAILAAIAVPNFLEAQVRAKVSRAKADMRTQATALEAYFVDYNVYTRDSDSSLDLTDVGADAFKMDTTTFTRCANGALQLTTPIAYMVELLDDPFSNSVKVEGAGGRGYRIASGTWSYEAPTNVMGAGSYPLDGDVENDAINTEDDQWSHLVFKIVGSHPAYAIICVGPDGDRARMAYKNFPYMSNYEADEGGIGTGQASDHMPQPLCWTEYDSTNGSASIGDVYRFGGQHRGGRYMLNGEVIGNQDEAAGMTTYTITHSKDGNEYTIIW
ncbi:MAG: type IV pilin protein [Candidatus Sumerlaeota bacterium]